MEPKVKAGRLRTRLARLEPRTREQLRLWLRAVLDIEVPARALVDGSSPPLDYLWHALEEPPGGKRDAVVWAARGGGKTFYAAVATVLDLLFKPGVEVKLLGGSLEQSQRMNAHLGKLLERPVLRGMLEGKVTERRVRLANGSSAEVLSQSHTSVRGARPQKLRCDEAELFDPDVWSAAQLCTRSRTCAGRMVHGSVEALSTCHEPFGLMHRIIESCGGDGTGRRVLFRWGLVDVLERCPASRTCEGCALWDECAGRARDGTGHFLIEDAVGMKARVAASDWEAEMLCRRARRRDAVFPEFDPCRHVRDFEAPSGALWIGGMDFGFRAPTVYLWAFVDAGRVLHVVDEHHVAGAVLEEHIAAIHARSWPKPSWVGIDPAGSAADGQTGVSHAGVLRSAGFVVRQRASSVELGLRLVRARLAPATGAARLVIHPRCARLIESLTGYHYPSEDPESRQPVKDGHDHAADALRYLVLNLDAPYRVDVGNYLGASG